MAQVNIRIDDDVKAKADTLFEELGINMSTAVNMFVRQAVRENGIPFQVKADPFWSEENQTHLRKAIADLEAGKGKPHELIEVD